MNGVVGGDMSEGGSYESFHTISRAPRGVQQSGTGGSREPGSLKMLGSIVPREVHAARTIE